MSLNPSLKLDWCSHEAAKYAVEHWHYSKRMPKSKLAKVGVWEDGKFIGVVIYGVGATADLVKGYGLKPTEGCELVRVALTTHETPVSRIVAISLKMIRKAFPKLRLVVSFADPREDHVGGIYQAGNWIYTGRSPECRFPLLEGRLMHPRQLSRRVKEGRVKRNEVEYVLTPGKYRYLMPLNSEIRLRILPLSKPYPKSCVSSVEAAHQPIQAESGGAVPTDTLQSSESNG